MFVILLPFPQSHLVKRFWPWWRDRMLEILPDKLRQLLIQKNRFFISFWDDESVTIQHQETGQQLKEVAHLPIQELRSWREQAELPEDPVFILLLAPGQFLRRRITLPTAARENLQQVVGFELDRHTPFNAAQVYYSTLISEYNPKKDHLVVDVVLTPRNVLNRLLARLQQAGIHLHQVSVIEAPEAAPELQFDLLPPQWKFHLHQWRRTLNLALSVLLVILVALAVTVPIIIHNQTIESLQSEIADARKAAQRANKLKEETLRLEQQARFVLEKKKATPALTAIIDELSQRLPQDTWLTGFQYRNHQVNIDGKSPSASKLVELLEESPYLKNVHFVSPITQDRSTGLERFRISMDIVNESESVSKK